MKKRVFSLFMALALCLSMLPAAAMAEDEGISTQAAVHEHCICGAEHKTIGDHGAADNMSTTFTEWTDELAEKQNGEGKTASNSLPAKSDFYYLNKDVTIGRDWEPANGTILCLNGHSITNKGYYGAITVGEGVTFTLTDCNGSNNTYHFSENYRRWKLDDSGSHEIKGGIITSTGSGSGVQNDGVFKMYGGTIVGNSGTSYNAGSSGNRGGGVYVRSADSRFDMYGGAITGNTASGGTADQGGGGVFVSGGEFTMYGGEIANNAATGHNATCGGGVNVAANGTFNMRGGTIGGEGKGNYADNGGAVYVKNATFNMSGDAAIIGNDARGSGAGVVLAGSVLEMSGNARIAGNTGYGVSVSFTDKGSSFTMSGSAAITGNTSGGVEMSSGGSKRLPSSFTVSGNVQITGNTKKDTPNNVYLEKVYDKEEVVTITIGEGGLGTNARIGVTTAIEPEGETQVQFAIGAASDPDYTKIITSDDDTYEVAYGSDGTTLVLKVAPEKPHQHYLCGGNACTKVGGHTENGKTTFEKKLTSSNGQLLVDGTAQTASKIENVAIDVYQLAAGSYYLDGDLDLTAPIYITSGTVNLCLNGHSITLKQESEANTYVITCKGNATLNLTDCKNTGKITHAAKKYGGGVWVYDLSSTLNLYAGSITGNNTWGQNGGGVSVSGTFNMYGGSVTGNTTNYNGGGVYVDSYSTAFKVSGAAKITGNTKKDTPNNVYLSSGKTFTLGGHFTRDTYIGVTTAEKPEGSETVTIASKVGELNYEDYVKADDSEKYEVKRSNGGLVLALKDGGTTPTEHKHFLCGGDSCNCPVTETKKVEFQPWESTTSLPKDTGNYYLTANVELDSYWKPADGIVLCLNGYSITVNKDTESVGPYIGAIVVESGRTFTLADCKGGKTEYGQITHGTNTETNSKYTGGGVCVYGTFNMYGGNITGNELTQKWYCGGGVSVYAAAGIFNLYGGSITDNKSNNTSTAIPCGEGGGVYTIGKFTMYGGTISGNEAHRSGGGVYAAGDFTMEGGTISNNTANGKYYTGYATYSGGGGVFVASGSRDSGGTKFTMKGGAISGNTVYGPGGGVYVAEPYGSFVMENGTISGNTALTNDESYSSGEGGGVFVRNCTFTMENGSITGNSAVKNGGGVCTYGKFTMRGGIIGGAEESDANTAGENGGGVFVLDDYSVSCTMSGNVTIIGNKKSGDGTDNNYYGGTITIGTDGLGDNAKIGMNMGSSWPTGTYGTRIAYKAKESDQGKFTSDKEGYEIKYNEREKELRLAKESGDPTPGKVDAGVKITAENANDPAPAEVIYGDTFKLGATQKTTGTAGRPITSDWTWTSSDPDVLSVTDNGSAATVKALKVGTATITVTYESEKAKGTATATITVNQRQISVKVDDKEMTVGGALPTFTVTYGNFAFDDTADTVLETKTPSTAADGKTAGSFDITVEAPTIKSNYADKYTVGTPQNGTLTVNAAENPPQPSSGSSSRPSYSVSTPGKTENGSVSADVKNAKKGSTVTITVKPEDGFKLADLTVTDKNGNELALTDKGDGKYTFTMPAGKVEISAAFAEEIETSPFEDVAADAYYYEAVKWAAEQGITEGTGKGLFGPEGTCTRGQIVTFLWRAAGSPVVNYAMDLADVDEDAYYAEAVRWALSEGVTSGTTDTTLAPDATCTRAQAMTFLFKAMKAAAEGKADFKDVADSDWFASAVAWALENGVTAGVGGGLFGPDNDCTRGQIVTFLWKLYAGK